MTKFFEVRDSGTFIPVIAIKLVASNEAERYLIDAAGYGKSAHSQRSYTLVSALTGGIPRPLTYDPYSHDSGARTMRIAHEYIREHWDELTGGEVIDVEYILGETAEPKLSEREALPPHWSEGE